jgi:ribosomal protein S18 acetylase RimI-like enzyme
VCGVKVVLRPALASRRLQRERALPESRGTLEEDGAIRAQRTGKNWEKDLRPRVEQPPSSWCRSAKSTSTAFAPRRQRGARAEYLALLEAPPEADTRKYVRDNIKERAPHFVALADGKVVGWCDLAVRPRPTQRHSGILGMGVIRELSRHGRRPRPDASHARTAAKASGIRRVELTVRVDNEPAKRLYESFGFVTEGCASGTCA